MSELKPCPFCGGEAYHTWSTFFVPEHGEVAHYVYCTKCPVHHADLLTTEEAIAAWNNRPGEDKLRQQRDELARMVLAVAYPVGMSQHVCQLCLGVRGAHADGCPAARATAHLQEGK